MTSVLSFILQVHDSVHDFTMKPNYNEPKIYTGGVDVSQWSKLSQKEKNYALKKHWYVYYSFRNPETGKLVQQKRIKAGANSYKTKSERLSVLKDIQLRLNIVLEAGYNPYKKDNTHIRRKIKGEPEEIVVKKSTPVVETSSKVVETEIEVEESALTLEEARKLVLDTKKKVLNENSYPRYTSRIKLFYKWLYENGFKKDDAITKVQKKTVIQYLNHVLHNSSARNRNNTRNDLSSFIATLVDNDVLQGNFVKNISKLTSKPKRNKTYNSEQLLEIKDYMDKKDPTLSLFVDFVSFGILRPIEVCRLKVGDLNIVDKKMQFQAKNHLVKEKIIPQILLDKLPDLSVFSKDDDLFTPTGIGGTWMVKEASKRDYFTKRFKDVKDHFGLKEDFGLYSFRHTTITQVYREIRKEPNMTPYAAKSKLMLITGHSSMDALNSYLRTLDAELPEDFSHLLKE